MKVKGLILLIFILFLLVIAGFIGSQNAHLVSINYLINDLSITHKMSHILAVSFLLGVLVCFIFSCVYVLRLKWRITRLERKNKTLTQSKMSK